MPQKVGDILKCLCLLTNYSFFPSNGNRKEEIERPLPVGCGGHRDAGGSGGGGGGAADVTDGGWGEGKGTRRVIRGEMREGKGGVNGGEWSVESGW